MNNSFYNALSVFFAMLFALVAMEGGLRLAGFNHRNAVGDYEEGIGWRYLPNQKVTTSFYFDRPITITINSLGLRGEELGQKRDGVPRILLLGDSFTLGYGVSDNETIPHYMEELLRDGGRETEVLNGGIGATTIFQQRGLYEKYGDAIDADEVMLLFCLNDLNDIYDYLAGNTPSVQHSVFVRSLKRFVYNTAIGNLLLKARLALKSRGQNAFFVSAAFADVNPRETYFQEFSKLLDLARQRTTPVTLVVLPFGPEPDAYDLGGETIVTFTEAVQKRFALSQSLDIFPLYKQFAEEQRPAASLPDGHYNANGNRIVATLMVEYLTGKNAASTAR